MSTHQRMARLQRIEARTAVAGGVAHADTIIAALDDPQLFLPFFPRQEEWARWRVFLKALFGLAMTDDEGAIYSYHTGREAPSSQPVKEAWLIVGRRGGKSRVAALVATYLAAFLDYRVYLAPGELAFIPIVAVDKRQARQIFRYLSAFFEQIPRLAAFVKRKGESGEWFLELSTRVQIEVFAGSFRANRGFTMVAFLGDEIAFWRSDEEYANPDVEILKSVRPGMLTIPNALMLNMSSPYARHGELYRAYARYFGKEDPDVLVWKATTEEMHPSIDAGLIARAYEEDPDAAAAEYGAEFRKDIESFVSREVLEAVIIPGRQELPASSLLHYEAFVDPSGGSQDSFTLAIAHREPQKTVLDVVREVRPPFSPEDTVSELCALLKRYGVRQVTGDAYAGQWPRERFLKSGVEYRVSELNKSDLYREALPLLNSRQVELLDSPRLKAQLLALERRVGRGGKGTIDHPPRGHDDLANAVAGVLSLFVEESVPLIAPPIDGLTCVAPWRRFGDTY